MRVRIEKCDSGEEEIVIRAQAPDARTSFFAELVANLSMKYNRRDIVLYSSGAEYYIPFDEILYFESSSGKVYAHTARSVYSSEYKLFTIEELFAPLFVRSSKSVVVNIDKIVSLRREIVGNGEIYFKDSEKKTYFSRAYYKDLKDKIQRMRLL